ncbi:MAG: hypothetical protein ABI051_02415 [Vicinamibacterales bacterium]
MSSIDTVLERDRAARQRERGIRVGLLLVLVCLLPTMLWAAAHGVTPLVRAAYALMAAGSAVAVFAEWMFLDWSRRALPGPADACSQLQRTASMLARQIVLMKTAPIWSSPIFVGVAMIGLWLYRDRAHSEAFVLWAITGAGWVAAGLGTASARAKLNKRRLQMEQLLSELQ